VILRIESVPAGAVVEDAVVGARLGETPHELELPVGAPRPHLRLARAGFWPEEISPPTDHSDTTLVKLRKKPRDASARGFPPAKPMTAADHGID